MLKWVITQKISKFYITKFIKHMKYLVYIIILFSISISNSCCKTEYPTITSNVVQVELYSLLDIDCGSEFKYYLLNDTNVFFGTNMKDTFQTYNTTSITYKMSYKKIGTNKCTSVFGTKELDMVEIISVVRN